MTLPSLALLEARVLGVLIEKQHTVPDAYPLTLNALVAGCNQKTSRDPVLNASDAEVQATLDRLVRMSLVVESSGGRVMRYEHNAQRVLALSKEAVAILATLMLRGAQTAAELRIHAERLHRFADTSSVEGYLAELAARAAGALVVELPRQPGARETRWAHLLSGSPPAATAMPVESDSFELIARSEVAALRTEVTSLRDEVNALKAIVARLCAELGVAPPSR